MSTRRFPPSGAIFFKEIFNETNQWYRWHHRRGIKPLESLGALRPQTFPKHPDCGWICLPGCGPPGSGPGESKWRGPKRDPQKPAWTQTRPWWCPSWRGWPQAWVTRTGFGPKSVAEGEDIQLKQEPKKRYKFQNNKNCIANKNIINFSGHRNKWMSNYRPNSPFEIAFVCLNSLILLSSAFKTPSTGTLGLLGMGFVCRAQRYPLMFQRLRYI